jgi:hypothetical protein
MNEPHGDLTDNDTAPLPPISDEPWGPTGGEPLQPFTDFSSSFAAPPSRDRSPAGTSHRRTIRRVIGSAAAAIVAVGIVGAVLMLRPDPAGTEVEAPAEATATARFLLAAPGADLQVLLRSSLAGAEVVTCPGRIQSPGPWRRNATPNQVAGTLICATRGDLATVAWTTDEKNLVNVAAGGQNGPTLAQLYTWWSSHS